MIKVYKLNITLKSQNDTFFSEWTGSAVRGSFGNSLIENYCRKNKTECLGCEFYYNCTAGLLFSTASPSASEQAVNPYIIDCSEEIHDKRSINFNITLFCNGADTVTDVLDTFKKGIYLGNPKTLFKMSEALNLLDNSVVFDGLYTIMPKYFALESEIYTENIPEIQIHFITPYCTKGNVPISFETVIRGCLRRISTLYRQCGKELDCNYADIIARAKNVRIIDKNIKNESRKRYSNRQSRSMNINGISGNMTFRGENLEIFMPYLKMCEIIHTGKLCVMGFGKISVG